MRITYLIGLLLLASCSDTDQAATESNVVGAATLQPSTSNIITTEAGRYRVEKNPAFDVAALPQTSELKMLDSNLAMYAARLCETHLNAEWAPIRCEVFLQPELNGNLVGYAVLKTGQDLQISAQLTTNASKGGLGCAISGRLENNALDDPDAKLDLSKNFLARLPYYAWERNPGDWLITTDNEYSDESYTSGVWYFERLGDKLNIARERWSYCYRDTGVPVDEVFTRAISLIRTP